MIGARFLYWGEGKHYSVLPCMYGYHEWYNRSTFSIPLVAVVRVPSWMG